ncbi:hypothetical protein SUGI_0549360 [Cryptomeria japonica]|nr:hypothetical protein SUGI_0549360 [Cryptomeria japonica]
MNPEVLLAAKNGDKSLIRNFFDSNPRQLKEVTFEGNTALHIAAREGHSELVEWILQNVKGLSGARNSDLNTPLHEAAKRGNAEIIRTLLRYNVWPAAKRNQFGESALLIASEKGHVEAVRALVEATPVYIMLWPREDHQTCLHVAAYGGSLEIVKLILERHSFCNILRLIMISHDIHGATPLHSAVHRGNLNIVSEIVKSKLPWWCCMKWFHISLMTKKDKFGRCAIHLAAIQGNKKMMEEFLSIMPDCIEIRSKDHKTALHFAVEHNQSEIVKMLLKEMVKLEEMVKHDDRDISGNTLLHLATINGVDPELVRYILPFLNVDAINNEGLRAIDVATPATYRDESKFTEIRRILEDQGASRSSVGNPRTPNSMDLKQGSNVSEKIMDMDTLVASLIATITFAAIFQIPGGIDDKGSGADDKHSAPAPAPGGDGTGVARMALETLFHVFLFSDSLAMFASLTVVIAWLFRQRLQTKINEEGSVLAKLSVLSLGISIVSTGLAFLTATILVTVPRHFKKMKDRDEYNLLLWGEILTAFAAPAVFLILLSIFWAIQYNFNATGKIRQRLRMQLKEALIYIIPPFAVKGLNSCQYNSAVKLAFPLNGLL